MFWIITAASKLFLNNSRGYYSNSNYFPFYIRSSRPTETPDLLTTSLTTTNEDITLSGFGARSTEKSVKLPEITTSVPVPDSISTTQRNRLTDFFRSRGTRRPFNFKSRANRIRTTRWETVLFWIMHSSR